MVFNLSLQWIIKTLPENVNFFLAWLIYLHRENSKVHELRFINNKRKLRIVRIFFSVRECQKCVYTSQNTIIPILLNHRLRKMSADVLFSKPTNNKACLNLKTTSLLRRSLLHASFYLKLVFPQPLIIFFSWGKSRDTHNESYQAVLPRLGRWRKAWWTESPGRRWAGAGGRTVETQREEKGQLSDLIHHLSGRRKRPQGDNRHLSVKSVWSINWGEWKRPPTPDCGGIKYKKERNNHRLSRRKSCWRSKGDRRAVDCSASLFLPDGSRELRKSDNQNRCDTIGEMIYSFPLYTFEFVIRATFYSSPVHTRPSSLWPLGWAAGWVNHLAVGPGEGLKPLRAHPWVSLRGHGSVSHTCPNKGGETMVQCSRGSQKDPDEMALRRIHLHISSVLHFGEQFTVWSPIWSRHISVWIAMTFGSEIHVVERLYNFVLLCEKVIVLLLLLLYFVFLQFGG